MSAQRGKGARGAKQGRRGSGRSAPPAKGRGADPRGKARGRARTTADAQTGQAQGRRGRNRRVRGSATTSTTSPARAPTPAHKRGERKGRDAYPDTRNRARAGSHERNDSDPRSRARTDPRHRSRVRAHADAHATGTDELPSFEAPAARSTLPALPQPGQWLFATREGSERDLLDELRLAGLFDPAACTLAPAVVLAPPRAGADELPTRLAFARQGFPIGSIARAQSVEAIADTLSAHIIDTLEDASATDYALQVFVPDSRSANPLAATATALHEQLAARLATALPAATLLDDSALRRQGTAHFAQVCLLEANLALGGVQPSAQAPSLAPGGRTRVRVAGDLPSRAARKLVEALAWLGMQPDAEELCVDLGAAPGGWCYVLTDRGARVIAVDPALLRPDIAARRSVRHVQESAFTFAPDEAVDWLFCDMAWRPLEVAALLAKWGRRRWTRMLVANIKLPMTRKAELLARIRHVIEQEGGYQELRVKQLYHDRDEVTLTARIV